MKTRGRPGRPARKLAPGERVPLNFRVPPELRATIERAANASGRSIAQETELRIYQSFERENLLVDALVLRYGAEAAGLLLFLMEEFVWQGRTAAFAHSNTFAEMQNWLTDPFAYGQAVRSADAVLKAGEPPGDANTFRGRKISEQDAAFVEASTKHHLVGLTTPPREHSPSDLTRKRDELLPEWASGLARERVELLATIRRLSPEWVSRLAAKEWVSRLAANMAAERPESEGGR